MSAMTRALRHPASLKKLAKIDLKISSPAVRQPRLGSPCRRHPGIYLRIGLNYLDHAAETGATVPSELIIFMKATRDRRPG